MDFSEKAKQLFRQDLLNYLNETYNFYDVTPIIPLEKFVTQYFQLLNGKMYRPSNYPDNSLIIALEKSEKILAAITDICQIDIFQLD